MSNDSYVWTEPKLAYIFAELEAFTKRVAKTRPRYSAEVQHLEEALLQLEVADQCIGERRDKERAA